MNENKRFYYAHGIIWDTEKPNGLNGIPINNLDNGLRITDWLNELNQQSEHNLAWGESNAIIMNGLSQYLKAYEEILDAFIKGIESEKGIDPDNEVFQKSMNCALKYLKRLKEEFENVDQYLKMKKELEKNKKEELND